MHNINSALSKIAIDGDRYPGGLERGWDVANIIELYKS